MKKKSPIQNPKSKILLGCHLSISGGVYKAAEEAREKSLTAFQIFTSNPRGWFSAKISSEDAARFRTITREPLNPIYPVAHMPYLPNLAAPDKDIYAKSVRTLVSELERCEALGIELLVTHLGSHLGEGEEGGRDRIARAILDSLGKADSKTMVLLENTAGTRNSLGTTPADLARIIDAVGGHERVGICIDTAHAFAAGYDWRSEPERLGAELKKAGIEKRVRVLHFNDSKVACGKRADRHNHLGLGEIGLDGLRNAVSQPIFKGLPIILETPVDATRDDLENIAIARSLI